VLVREPAYRRALAQVSTPLDAVGEPIEVRRPAEPEAGRRAGRHRAPVLGHAESRQRRHDTTWAGVIVANAEAAPAVVDAGFSAADRRAADRRAAGQADGAARSRRGAGRGSRL
jgi:hypothetical protein